MNHKVEKLRVPLNIVGKSNCTHYCFTCREPFTTEEAAQHGVQADGICAIPKCGLPVTKDGFCELHQLDAVPRV